MGLFPLNGELNIAVTDVCVIFTIIIVVVVVSVIGFFVAKARVIVLLPFDDGASPLIEWDVALTSVDINNIRSAVSGVLGDDAKRHRRR